MAVPHGVPLTTGGPATHRCVVSQMRSVSHTPWAIVQSDAAWQLKPHAGSQPLPAALVPLSHSSPGSTVALPQVHVAIAVQRSVGAQSVPAPASEHGTGGASRASDSIESTASMASRATSIGASAASIASVTSLPRSTAFTSAGASVIVASAPLSVK